MTDFNMPKTGSWEELGGWIVNTLAHDLDIPIPNAAGFVGNLGAETSGLKYLQEKRPIVPGSAGGRGWSQWTGSRRRAFESWSASHNLNPDSPEANYGFLVAELKTPEWQPFLDLLRNASGLEEACHLTLTRYERPLDQSATALAKRVTWAKRALEGARAASTITTTTQPVLQPSPELQHVAEDLITFDMVKPAIQNLQTWLRLSGDYDGSIDGIPGKGTFDAITNFTKRTRK